MVTASEGSGPRGDPTNRAGRRAAPPISVVGAAVAVAVSAALAASVLVFPRSLQADGGTLRAANVPMGAYRVNVFTDPTPIPPDSIDVSVLVTFERGRSVAPGLEVLIRARPMDLPGAEIRHPATREQATDPRYYSAKFSLGSAGNWEIIVQVRGPEGEGEVSFEVRVQEPGVFGSPYLILVLALLPLALVGWWLRQSDARRRPPQGGAPPPPDEAPPPPDGARVR